MYKCESMENFSVEAVARDGNCLLSRFLPFGPFEIIPNNVLLCVNTREDYMLYVKKEWSMW